MIKSELIKEAVSPFLYGPIIGGSLGAIYNLFLPKEKKNFLKNVGYGVLLGSGANIIPGASRYLGKYFKPIEVSSAELSKLKLNPHFNKFYEEALRRNKLNNIAKELKNKLKNANPDEINIIKGKLKDIKSQKFHNYMSELKKELLNPIDSFKKQWFMSDYYVDNGKVFKRGLVPNLWEKHQYFGFPLLAAYDIMADKSQPLPNKLIQAPISLYASATPKILPSLAIFESADLFRHRPKQTHISQPYAYGYY